MSNAAFLILFVCMIPRLLLRSQQAAETRPVHTLTLQHKGNKAVFRWGVLLTELTDPHSFIFRVVRSIILFILQLFVGDKCK